MHIEMHR